MLRPLLPCVPSADAVGRRRRPRSRCRRRWLRLTLDPAAGSSRVPGQRDSHACAPAPPPPPSPLPPIHLSESQRLLWRNTGGRKRCAAPSAMDGARVAGNCAGGEVHSGSVAVCAAVGRVGEQGERGRESTGHKCTTCMDGRAALLQRRATYGERSQKEKPGPAAVAAAWLLSNHHRRPGPAAGTAYHSRCLDARRMRLLSR